MQDDLFFIKKLRKKFLEQKLTDLSVPLDQNILDIEDKTRGNFFPWRGQFSPQLIENLLLAYCPRNATILDPFAGSGTVLYESACLGVRAFGCEINPAAWSFTKLYEMANLPFKNRQELIKLLKDKLDYYFPHISIFNNFSSSVIETQKLREKMLIFYNNSDYFTQIIIETWIILLDLNNKQLTLEHIHNTFFYLCRVIQNIPYSDAKIITYLCDARNLIIENNTIDFIVTSPPYINVFNYHQNYRYSAEFLGWDLLKIAKSEIGSNRANRGNRFLTVIQYCLDLASVLKEMQRVCRTNAGIIFVVGSESNVLGVPFYNSKIIADIAQNSGVFELVLTQQRKFKNKFGKIIYEDLLHLVNKDLSLPVLEWDAIARKTATQILNNSLSKVSDNNKYSLLEAIKKVDSLSQSLWYNGQNISRYRTSPFSS